MARPLAYEAATVAISILALRRMEIIQLRIHRRRRTSPQSRAMPSITEIDDEYRGDHYDQVQNPNSYRCAGGSCQEETPIHTC